MSDKKLQLTEVDRRTLKRLPDGWFSRDDVTYMIRCPDHRCERLEQRGVLESRVVGEYPHLQREWRKVPRNTNPAASTE